MTKFADGQKFSRNLDFPATEMDGEIVVMSVEHGDYYAIGGVGSQVWRLLEEPNTLVAILETICRESGVDQATCRADLETFFSDLLDNNLIRLS